MDNKERLLTVAELAERLRVSTWSAGELVRNGTVPHLRIGRRIRIRESALNEWIRRLETGGGDGNDAERSEG